MPKPADALASQKLKARPKSVGWNPFNNTLNKSQKRSRSRSTSRNALNSTNATPPRTTSSPTTNSTASLNNNTNTTTTNNNNNNNNNSALFNSATLTNTNPTNSATLPPPSTPYLSATQLSQLPDTKVWESLSTMSLRDLAAGHHCPPHKVIPMHSNLGKHLDEVNRMESLDKHRAMMTMLAKREESRWRLANRKRERIAIQEYCSQPVLHIPDPSIELNISEPMTVGEVLRAKYHKTHPKPSYNARLNNRLNKRADVRALRMILNRFDQSEQHEDHVNAIKDFSRNMSRGNLRVAAMKRSELETRLGTPFAMSGASMYTKPGTGSINARSSTASSPGKRGRRGSNNKTNVRRAVSAGAFGIGAFDTPAGVAQPNNNMLSMPVLRPVTSETTASMRPETAGHESLGMGAGAGAFGSLDGGGSEIPPSEKGGGRKPIWQQDPHEHWKPPSYHLRYLERAATSPGQKRARGGFPNKYLYPIEISGLNTLFPE